MLLVCLAGMVGGVVLIARGDHHHSAQDILLGVGTALVSLGAIFGVFVVQPNEARVLQFFGKYNDARHRPALDESANTLIGTKRKISLRVRSFESQHLKVNDIDGNPIEIAAIVVWKVVDTAEAAFQVENFEQYVHTQAEAALRNLATRFSYDAHDDAQVSLRGHTVAIAGHLKDELHERLQKAGVEILEARISHLAYAPEIAGAMLQRQQASAIIAARTKIVEGAVTMVEMALQRLAKDNIVQLDDQQRAAMVSNLLVVLCGQHAVQPIVNTGTIYQ